MTDSGNSSGDALPQLTHKTSFLGLKVYVLIGVLLLIMIAVVLLIVVCIWWKRSATKRKMRVKHSPGLIPLVSKEIMEVKALDLIQNCEKTEIKIGDVDPKKEAKVAVEIEGKGQCSGGSDVSGGSRSDVSVDAHNFGWGRWYSLKELETATRGFAEDNVVGEGGYGVVYRGDLQDGSVVAVKNLLNNKGQAEKEFKVEVEAIGKVRHKNLVGLVGFCTEGAQRMLVYEYVDNGNLEQWLHGDVGPVSPLTWEIRMRIAIGTAKGLTYLHEGLEPKVVHRDVKSSNILLDKKWTPKVSDFGLAKLLGSEASYVTTRVMGTFGFVLSQNHKSIEEAPVDYSRPAGEMNLVDWFKGMVASRRGEEVVDPLIEVQPSPRSLKRALLVCLRCIDLDVNKRPKMGQIVHMLEADDFPFRAEPRSVREKDSLPYHASVSSKVPNPRNQAGGAGGDHPKPVERLRCR
ncbi:Protein kinase family protein [Quillaja saponaria]|uniref:non-specific serine/threonine protein kinase n=1 Tax=Quillaja saponaria TaxID=32244 RepID=A0AAD7LZT5_QUISA|nr:Protein kinase family protein [Quillaja saponaria]